MALGLYLTGTVADDPVAAATPARFAASIAR
jgi:hypothetical protein